MSNQQPGEATEREYIFQVSWTMAGQMRVRAESLAAAVAQAHYREGLPEGEYVGDSFQVDVELGVSVVGPDGRPVACTEKLKDEADGR